jgi:diaminohydroxyphosphoribosylaminopyrimidine deaminase / 5-amino-6-(5-phosphoribosylamino)uracil reductase
MAEAAHDVFPLHPTVDSEQAWRLLLGLREHCSRHGKPERPYGLRLVTPEGGSPLTEPASPISLSAVLTVHAGGELEGKSARTPGAAELFEQYLELAEAGPGNPITIGHLGQSLDGRIACLNGDSQFITGQDDLRHMHRLRALADAVVVGVNTAIEDDPRLTTRMVPGSNPVRVVLDPHRRLNPNAAMLNDGEANTLVLCSRSAINGSNHVGQAELVALDGGDDGFSPREILRILHDRGLYSVFVEGGGLTVSRFLEQDVLDRLQVTIAPVILGSGRQGISLPPIHDIDDARRHHCRVTRLGHDMMFDCQPRRESRTSAPGKAPKSPTAP